jgi:conjugative transfer signal peptidase TraF
VNKSSAQCSANTRSARFCFSRVLCASLCCLTALAILSVCFANRQIVINTSPSVKSGLYVRSRLLPATGALVDFRMPVSVRSYIQLRTGRDSRAWYILKPIVAGPGDRVDTENGELRINGRFVATMPPVLDGFGNRLPRWIGNRNLDSDEFYVFSDRIPNSFDSRCYGPVHRSEIESVRRPLITW